MIPVIPVIPDPMKYELLGLGAVKGSLADGSWQEERTLESEQNLGHSKKLELQGIMPHSTTRKMHSIV